MGENALSDNNFAAIEERIRKFELSQIHPSEEWQHFFADAIALLDHPDSRKKEYALDRLQKGVWAERMQQHRQPGYTATPSELRLTPILNAIGEQNECEHLLAHFTKWASFSGDQNDVFAQWLAQAECGGKISEETVAILKIQAELFPLDDWAQAQNFLEPFFDHPNDLLRAASAAAFGDMYSAYAENLPPLVTTLEQVKSREIARPGFAGAFIGPLLMGECDNGYIGNSGIKLEDWLLEIFAKRKAPEPEIPFYNGIDFHAHEVLSGNADAVQKLVEFGAESVAAMAATEEHRPIPGMLPILEQLSNSTDDFVARICSWHLANNYRTLHPNAELRGFVRLAKRDHVDIFLVFDPQQIGERPYAATIYPKNDYISEEVSRQWTEKLVPPQSRPPMAANDWPYQKPQIESEYAMYVYGAYIIKLYGDSASKKWERIWVKWPLPDSNW